MGRIADAIDEIEEELAEKTEALKVSEQHVDELAEIVEQQRKTINEYQAMEDYLEEYHPGIITAFEVVQRMEK